MSFTFATTGFILQLLHIDKCKIIDLNNELLQDAHLICAAHELSLKKEEVPKYFNCDGDILDKLVSQDDLLKNPRGNYIYPYDDSPSFNHNLDQISSQLESSKKFKSSLRILESLGNNREIIKSFKLSKLKAFSLFTRTPCTIEYLE